MAKLDFLNDDGDDPELKFGKHKGERISEVPTGYLDWLIDQDWLDPKLEEKIVDLLQTRADWHASEED